jgi:hypothetical protein
MHGVRWQLRLERGLADQVDAEAGRLGQARSVFIRRALESALAAGGEPEAPVASSPTAAAPSRAPEWDDPEAHRRAQEDFGRARVAPRAAPFNVGPKPFRGPVPKGE